MEFSEIALKISKLTFGWNSHSGADEYASTNT